VSQHLTMIGSVYGGYLTTSLEFQSVGSILFFFWGTKHQTVQLCLCSEYFVPGLRRKTYGYLELEEAGQLSC
jgi:hypothetical protein